MHDIDVYATALQIIFNMRKKYCQKINLNTAYNMFSVLVYE